MSSIAFAGNRKGQPNYPREGKEQIAAAPFEPEISMAKLAMAHKLNVNVMFRWHRELRALEGAPAQPLVTLLLIVLQ